MLIFFFFKCFDSLMLQLQHIESICLHYFLDLSLPFHFLTIEESVYRIQLYLNLFYEDYDAINQHYQKQIHLLFFFSSNPS